MTNELNALEIATDDQGYLVYPEQWDETVARSLADQYGIELGDEHWKILHFIRDYYHEHQIAVDARFVIKYLAEELGYKQDARQRLYALFPYGYMQQVCKIAGMKRPRAWSTG